MTEIGVLTHSNVTNYVIYNYQNNNLDKHNVFLNKYINSINITYF